MKAFKIALCGLFQTGKSTTINALAGGLEICAQSINSGIRTSACNVYIYGSTQEKCRIELISDEEICLRLAQVLNCKIEILDLWKHQARELLWQRLNNIWQDETEDFEPIEGASLLISGLGFLPFLRKKIQNMSVKQVAMFGKAPDDEIIRWGRFRRQIKEIDLIQFKHLLREEFPIQEVLYPFVKNIVVQLNAPQLMENNICIIDTPGLSANKRDTETALRAVRQANAILYILSGEKEPGELERQFLYQLHSIIEDKTVIFAVNCQKKLRSDILEAIQAVLQICGYENAEPFAYNAILSLRIMQGLRLMKNHLSRTLIKSLIASAKFQDFDVINAAQAWSLLTAKDLATISKCDSKLISRLGLCESSIEILNKYSGLSELIYKMKR